MPQAPTTVQTAKPVVAPPNVPAVVAGHGRAALLTTDGELLTLPAAEAARALQGGPPPLLIHAPATFRRLGLPPGPALDLLELFAFVLPARPVPPTPRGLALELDQPPPATMEDAAALLPRLAEALLARLVASASLPRQVQAAGLAATMGAAGWPWARAVLAALGQPAAQRTARALRVWDDLPKWEEEAPLPPPGHQPVQPAEARTRLAAMLGPSAEQRPGQADYASAAAAAFAPRTAAGDPAVVLAEAGTGTGKTLGYVAPASLWAERNGGAVWISTYTRHLQRQIDAELARLHPDPAERRRRAVVRKGRENYLCLLNLQEATSRLGASDPAAIPLALVARWALATADGDVVGGDLPGWMPELFGPRLIPSVADRRGECIHGACTHYQRCYVEHVVRRARRADLVVANHALVMAQASWGGIDDASVPTRYVFDEGHHVFDAADNAFSAELSGMETALLRRWMLGAEEGRTRAKGLRPRLEAMVAEHVDITLPLGDALHAARALPGDGWSARLHGQPQGETERFLHAARLQVLARTQATDGSEPASNEDAAALYPATDALIDAARALAHALRFLLEPLVALRQALQDALEGGADTLETDARRRIEAAARMLKHRAIDRVQAWVTMLAAVSEPPPEPGTRPEHLHILRIQRRADRDADAGLHRHWLDPTIPFAATLARPAHGLLVTSATLRDSGTDDAEVAWLAAEARVGAGHLPSPALRVAVASPFDYASQTRAFVVTDVGPDGASLAGAYRALFQASGGGALGLFTAIARLRDVHRRIAAPLEADGLTLLAQHVDAMDNATLVDVFRTELDSCLLGTDAMRDGVDVPGRALRLVVFDRVPWPRADLLHKERRIHLSNGNPREWDDGKARLKLRQAFGRLVRSATDHGVFVLLDRRAPSRLMSAFPQGVQLHRVGLAEAVAQTRAFLTIP